jgi:ribonucleoside-diphosphate reductase alpha chain
MDALRRDDDYELLDPRSKSVRKKVRARTVFDELVRSAWETGDPGVIFIDVINRSNPTPHIGEIESTNPCGEQPLLP